MSKCILISKYKEIILFFIINSKNSYFKFKLVELHLVYLYFLNYKQSYFISLSNF